MCPQVGRPIGLVLRQKQVRRQVEVHGQWRGRRWAHGAAFLRGHRRACPRRVRTHGDRPDDHRLGDSMGSSQVTIILVLLVVVYKYGV